MPTVGLVPAEAGLTGYLASPTPNRPRSSPVWAGNDLFIVGGLSSARTGQDRGKVFRRRLRVADQLSLCRDKADRSENVRRLPVPLRFVAQPQTEDPLEQLVVANSSLFGGLGQIFTVGQVGIRIGFEHVYAAVVGHSQVHAGITAKTQHAVDAFAESPDGVLLLLSSPLASWVTIPSLFLVGVIPLNAGGGDTGTCIGQFS